MCLICQIYFDFHPRKKGQLLVKFITAYFHYGIAPEKPLIKWCHKLIWSFRDNSESRIEFQFVSDKARMDVGKKS